VRRALDLAGTAVMLDRIARARVKARAHVRDLIEKTPAGFPWLVIAGKTLTGWLVIDMDATLVTASSDNEGAAATWKKGYGFHPLGAWCASTRECLAMLLRPGNAGSNTFTDHKEVLTAAIRQVPARFRRKILVRVDGAGASHELLEHRLSLSSARRMILFTCGWMITAADEDAIRQAPAGAWKPGTCQDGTIEDDKEVAEITGLMSRAGNWPDGLRWIARRVKPSRRHLRNLTDYEKKTGWKYSITCTNIPDAGIAGVPGSHHPQYIDVVHREHAAVETSGVRTAKAMGLRNLQRQVGQRPVGPVGEDLPDDRVVTVLGLGLDQLDRGVGEHGVVAPGREQLVLPGGSLAVEVTDPPHDQPGGDLLALLRGGERGVPGLGDLGVTDLPPGRPGPGRHQIRAAARNHRPPRGYHPWRQHTELDPRSA
jgi:hypothetical protein